MAECKSKWGSLRNSYNRAVREGRDTASGSKGSKKRKWYLMDAMEFLRDFVGVHRKLGSNTMGTNSEENLAETVEPDLVDTISTENLEENLHSAVIQTHEFENVSSPASVSYTHLDVYKRQVLHRNLPEGNQPQLKRSSIQ